MRPPTRLLPVPDGKEDLERLTLLSTFNDEEQKRWDELCERLTDDCGASRLAQARFFEQERKRKNAGTAWKRQIHYQVGYAYEYAAQHQLKCRPPLYRAELFSQAANAYQRADEVIGMFSDFALRQSEACAGTAVMRKRAGYDDAIAESYARRAGQLIHTLLGDNVIVVGRDRVKPHVSMRVAESAETRLSIAYFPQE